MIEEKWIMQERRGDINRIELYENTKYMGIL